MKKRINTLLTILACFLLGITGVKADKGSYSYISADDTTIYTTEENIEVGTVEGITYDTETKTLTLENVDIKNLSLAKNYGITILLKGENVIDEYFYFSSADITIKGDGNLTVKGNNLSEYPNTSITVNSTEVGDDSDFERITFAMTGTVTALKGFGGSFDRTTSASEFDEVIKFGEKVSIKEGGNVITDGSYVYIAPDGISYDERSNVKVVISGVKEETTTDENKNEKNPASGEETKNEEVTPAEDENKSDTNKTEGKYTITIGENTFTAKEELASDYELKIEDKKNDLKDEQIKDFEKTIKDSHLVLLYNISVVDGNNEIVPMENGEYTIRLKLTKEAMENYDAFTVIYVDDNGEIKETFKTKVDGEYVEFTTTHLSDYGVLGVKEETENKTEAPTDKKEEVENPRTSDNVIVIASVAVIALVGTAVTLTSIIKRLHN